MFSLDRLFEPICAEAPCGADLAFSPEIDAIERARRFDDPTLEQGVWQVAPKEADWAFVAHSSAELLQSRSKDLRLAIWLAEAGARLRGLRGMGDGYFLLAGLCERYWDELYPLAEDGDCERRIGNLAWLLNCSPQLLQAVPIAEGEPAYSAQDLAQARRTGDPGPIERARAASSRSFYETLLADADYCMRSLARLEQVLAGLLGVHGPAFGPARGALEDLLALVLPAAQAAGAGVAEMALAVPAQAGAAVQGGAAIRTGPIRDRAQALAQLRAIADFFRQSEPHSPVAYLADKAASWGEMPLHVWLRAVVKDPGALGQLDDLLGCAPAPH